MGGGEGVQGREGGGPGGSGPPPSVGMKIKASPLGGGEAGESHAPVAREAAPSSHSPSRCRADVDDALHLDVDTLRRQGTLPSLPLSRCQLPPLVRLLRCAPDLTAPIHHKSNAWRQFPTEPVVKGDAL